MHDKNGKPLAKGDRVTVECVVKEGYATNNGEYCNITVETVEPMYPTDGKTQIVFNSRQVVKVEGETE